jgi:hypothetical protein
MPWWAKVAVCQTVLFPITSLYSTLPLLLAWSAFAPALALAGTGLSWLWVLLALPKSFGMVWLFILLPWMLTALWSARPTQRAHARSWLPMRWQDGAARPTTTE